MDDSITMDKLITMGVPQFHGRLPNCEIENCHSSATMEITATKGQWYVLCDKHYLVYLSYLGLVRESKL
jgi:hypothetical protein